LIEASLTGTVKVERGCRLAEADEMAKDRLTIAKQKNDLNMMNVAVD
jgi:hypothetical protein